MSWILHQIKTFSYYSSHGNWDNPFSIAKIKKLKNRKRFVYLRKFEKEKKPNILSSTRQETAVKGVFTPSHDNQTLWTMLA
ncbi:hypothetical protein CHS0354_042436 [Potamilus streckersoni]|uniref:Uncharacterized protein n=1 Tax=Potamilus streckersoni TaxID=2493646 RepID=A0AAE0W104_9BIVA|nr:hypothetical protein CHS0354_042436 [Potamilus streckersoni]